MRLALQEGEIRRVVGRRREGKSSGGKGLLKSNSRKISELGFYSSLLEIAGSVKKGLMTLNPLM